MKKITILFLLPLLMCFSACKKISQSKIDACIYVKQYKTETPIANAEVQILRGKPGLGYGTEVVETINTDAAGMAIYKTKIDKDYSYFAFAHKENYSDEDVQVVLSPGKRNFKTTIFKYANAYVKLHIKNVSPFNQYDLIELQSYCHPNLHFQGLNIDTTIRYCDYGYEWLGDFEYSYAAVVTKNGVQSIIHYSFIPVPSDTITVDINY